MTYVVLVVSGILIGLIVAAPIGPVNLICIRRTLAFGALNGLVSGLGAALGDGIFALVTAYGLTAIAHLIEGFSQILQIAGGALLLGFGVHTYLADPLHGREVMTGERAPRGSSMVRTFVSTFALTLSNPATLFGFAALFTGFGGIVAGANASLGQAAFVVIGVVCGSSLWWLTLTTVVGYFHARVDARVMRIINHVSGIAVGLFGLGVLAHVLIERFR
ncbi:MAG TPA: LysE family transporter [Rhizomicrobium sp.]|jgi:threonine/homoserine/homoserine lactone efflux protein